MIIAGPVFVCLSSPTNSDDERTSENSYNLNSLTTESLIGSTVILVTMSIWIAFMYRNRPDIISEELFSGETQIVVENMDKNIDLETSSASFDENQSTNSNSHICMEDLAALRSQASD